MKIIQLLDLVDTKPFSTMNAKNNTSLDLERPKLLVNRFVSSAQEGSFRNRESPRNLNVNKKPLQPKKKKEFVRPPVKDSLREKHIKEWAFKKIDLKDLIKIDSQEFEDLKKKNEIPDDDDELLEQKPEIDLSELTDPEADAEFYRQHRNSGMYKNKADAQKNILFKLLDKRLLDISKDRFKFMNYVDYQKKIFIKKQMLKSKSLPGLNCAALETHKPHQFDQLQDMETAMNQAKKKAHLNSAVMRKKSAMIKSLNLNTNRSNTFANLAKEKHHLNKNRSDNSDSEENEPFKFEINNIMNSIKKISETNSNLVNTNKSLNQHVTSHIHQSPKSNEIGKKFVFLDESFQMNQPNDFNQSSNRETFKRESIYRFAHNRRDTTRVSSNEDGVKSVKAPMVDYRFNNLINFIKPCYLHRDPKDVHKIINENEALKSNNLNPELKEKNRKMRINGEKLADVARRIIESGEYSC